jgi:hypothetical protein
VGTPWMGRDRIGIGNRAVEWTPVRYMWLQAGQAASLLTRPGWPRWSLPAECER